MEEQLVRVRLGTVVIGAAALLVAGSAVGLLGTWAMVVGVALIVASSVVTAIVWEERDAAAGARAVAVEGREELVPVQAAGR